MAPTTATKMRTNMQQRKVTKSYAEYITDIIKTVTKSVLKITLPSSTCGDTMTPPR
ncbi:hypothetical protein AHF37_01756 [Paragonimus kellicotti]|nr:hypothetical protein AHF37_01756 [Paragonimus kellicotti]